MKPVELMDIVLDDTDHVIEIHASQEMFDRLGLGYFEGVTRVVREPVMFSLALPEIEPES